MFYGRMCYQLVSAFFMVLIGINGNEQFNRIPQKKQKILPGLNALLSYGGILRSLSQPSRPPDCEERPD